MDDTDFLDFFDHITTPLPLTKMMFVTITYGPLLSIRNPSLLVLTNLIQTILEKLLLDDLSLCSSSEAENELDGCWISPVVTFWSNLYTNMFKGNPIRRKAHRIVKYLKLKRMNPSIELRELVLNRVKFKNKALLKETLIIDGLEQN